MTSSGTSGVPPAASAVGSVAGAALSVGNTIGRYFNIATVIPSLLLVVWTYSLLASGSAVGPPHLDELATNLTFSAERLTGMILGTIFISLFLHPLQFGTTRLLEGYWGRSRIALGYGAVRVRTFRERRRRLVTRADRHERRIFRVIDDKHPIGLNPDAIGRTEWRKAMLEKAAFLMETKDGDQLVLDLLGKQEALRKEAEYPDADRILPTMLGNALRSFEDSAGRQYGLDAIQVAPHLVLASQARHVEYVEDSRQSMDVSIRLCLISLLATVESVALLLTDGPWLFVALGPYLLAYIAYRGAISSARAYGVAFSTMTDLNRFALYESLQLRRPPDSDSERKQNFLLHELLGPHGDETRIVYRPDPAAAQPKIHAFRSR